jgi:hypothetical protein
MINNDNFVKESAVDSVKKYFFLIGSVCLLLGACNVTTSPTKKSVNTQNIDKEKTVLESSPKNEKRTLPDWLLPPPVGALVTQVMTVYEHPVTGERYQTTTGGYTIVVK